jgi:hypothetical protein
MSDDDFEFIDASQVVTTQRNRKPKYKYRPWEADTARGQYEYYKLLQLSYMRRHGNGETPYDHLIDPRIDYVAALEKIMPYDIAAEVEKQKAEAIDLDICDYCGKGTVGFAVIASDYHNNDLLVCDDCLEDGDSICSSCGDLFDSYNDNDECDFCSSESNV